MKIIAISIVVFIIAVTIYDWAMKKFKPPKNTA